MNLECPRCGKSPWNWAGETEDYCRCDEEFGGFLEQPPNYQQHKPIDPFPANGMMEAVIEARKQRNAKK